MSTSTLDDQQTVDEQFQAIIANNYPAESSSDPYNPGQQHQDRLAGSAAQADPAQRLRDQEQAQAGTGTAGSTGGLDAAESSRAGAAANIANTAANIAGVDPASRAIASATNWIMGNKRNSTAGAIVGIVVTVMGMFGASVAPSALLVAIKDGGTSLFGHTNTVGRSLFTRSQLQNRFFGDPSTCKAVNIVCKARAPGLSARDIKTLQDDGATNIKSRLVKTGLGRSVYVIDSFTLVGSDGKNLDVNKTNFTDLHSTRPELVAFTNKHFDPRRATMSGRSTERLRKILRISKAPTEPAKSTKDRVKQWRERMYGGKKATSGLPDAGGSSNSDPNAQRAAAGLDGISTAAEDAAQNIERGLLENGPPASAIGDVGSLDTTDSLARRGTAIAEESARGGGLGALFGPFEAANHLCSVYKVIRVVSFMSQVYGAAQLMIMAHDFMREGGDSIKAGLATAGGVALLGNALARSSSLASSKGKGFSQSYFAQAALYGVTPSGSGNARFSVGTPIIQGLTVVRTMLDSHGVSAKACRVIGQWYVQAGMAIAGVALCIVTATGTCFEGIAQGVVTGALVGSVNELLMPKMALMLASAIVPDLLTDPEGGFGIGNALYAGLGAFFLLAGHAGGMSSLTKQQKLAFDTMTAQQSQTIAAAYRLESSQQGMFDINNPSSVPTRMAVALAPLYQQQSVGSFLGALVGVASSGPAAIFKSFNPNASAITDPLTGGGKCGDEDKQNLDLATDDMCNDIVGVNPKLLDSTEKKQPKLKQQYTFDNATQWMYDQKQIDANGTIIGDDYKHFHTVCNSDDGAIHPLTTDGYGADVNDSSQDTSICHDDSPQSLHFWAYSAGASNDEDQQASLDGTLGLSEDEAGNPATAPIPSQDLSGTYENGKIPASALCPLGDAWPGETLRCDAQAAFVKLNDAYKQRFGTNMTIDDSYRSYDQQVIMKQKKGKLAAKPGTSKHGWGVALDIGGGVNNFGTAQYTWMKQSAGTYGWQHPAWAESKDTPEPWHWEFGTQ